MNEREAGQLANQSSHFVLSGLFHSAVQSPVRFLHLSCSSTSSSKKCRQQEHAATVSRVQQHEYMQQHQHAGAQHAAVGQAKEQANLAIKDLSSSV
jgi:hypothetical protein